MGQGPETRLVNQIRKALDKAHPSAFIFKAAGGPYQMAGIPDLLGCITGTFIGIEVKAQRRGESRTAALNRVTTRQRMTLDRITRAGGVAGVALSVDDALAITQHLKEKETP